jgi:hypothetical protein
MTSSNWSCSGKALQIKLEHLNSGARQKCQFVKSHPRTVVFACLLFLTLLAGSVIFCVGVYNAQKRALEEEALALAEETGLFFADMFHHALLPLFSLAQFVSELQVFRELEYHIGYAGERNARPLASETHRNVTGICDDPTLVARFSKIAATINLNAGMEGVLLNLQLVPDAVVCLVYPLNNMEAFPSSGFVDKTDAIGHDLLADPTRKIIAEATLASGEIVISDPLSLRQCDGCHPAVERAFIARLPLPSLMTDEERKLRLGNGTSPTAGQYQKWGFVVALIDWNALIEKSGIYETFENGHLEFRMTQTNPAAKDNTDDIKVRYLCLYSNVQTI